MESKSPVVALILIMKVYIVTFFNTHIYVPFWYWILLLYIAPEILLDESVQAETDMWSMGVLIYTLYVTHCNSELFLHFITG